MNGCLGLRFTLTSSSLRAARFCGPSGKSHKASLSSSVSTWNTLRRSEAGFSVQRGMCFPSTNSNLFCSWVQNLCRGLLLASFPLCWICGMIPLGLSAFSLTPRSASSRYIFKYQLGRVPGWFSRSSLCLWLQS